ncbi:class I SAM-dependent methyltransferase [Mycobacterium sp.]|uniref:class I SAM-dependent methyltransferase n=1 Tax=Mycobacterium sp. TaxID=1785 RepID=UPI002D715BA0|nr:class I SAM-dependent methyltransferase [Mycobacterium sp.]HZA08734.1 class I SAM-dependent methyltransferase [Mycobacterium sp.]
MARTDNDTWDLASSVGATATMVASQRVVGTRAGLINDPFAEPLVRAVGAEFFIRLIDGEIDLDDVDPEFNMRRAAEGIAVRTRFFDRLFTEATAAGVRQAVILAAGLDARAYRLPWPDGTVVYEVDQPEVIEFKTRTLAGLGAEPTAERRAVGIDLRHDWPKALVQNGFDRTEPTAWIAEGLLVYLPPEAQDRLFDNITDLSVPGSRVATEHIPDMTVFAGGRLRRISERLKKYGHDIEMADLVYHGERSHVTEYLTSLGWDVSALPMREAYAANGFEFRDDEMTAPFANLSYVSAVLR